MLRSKLVRITAVIALVVLAGACSSKGSSAAPNGETPAGETSTAAPPVLGGASADEYAAAVCTALASWSTSLQAQAQDFANIATDPSSAVDGINAFVDETDQLIDTLNALGAPDVEGGEEAHTLLVSALTTLRDSYAGLADAFANIDPTDPQAVTQALSEFEAAFSNDDLSAQFDALQDTEIAQAFQSQTACTKAGFGTGSASG
jgi:hypothetical protein